MALLSKRQRRWIEVISAAFVMLGFGLLSSLGAAEDNRQAEQMTGSMKVVCVGRYLIHTPAQASFSLGRGFVGGYAIPTSFLETDDEFATRVRQFEAELSSARNGHGGLSLA